jgi:hypothetical protein
VATWDERAGWYIEMVTDPERGFNHLAADVAFLAIAAQKHAPS